MDNSTLLRMLLYININIDASNKYYNRKKKLLENPLNREMLTEFEMKYQFNSMRLKYHRC